MYQLINEIITDFRPFFKRERTWKWFAIVVMAFMLRLEHRGVTSIVSALGLQERFYEQILHFFHSDAYEVAVLYGAWQRISQRYIRFEEECGYVILASDPIKIPKEGKRMPAVHDYHQDSENSGKKEYVEAHQFGAVSGIVTNGEASRCLFLSLGIQESKTKTGKESLIEQTVNQCGDILPSLDKPGLAVLDAYFCVGSTFHAADKFNDESGTPRLAVITRAKRDTTGFTQPPPRKPKQRGATRKYGEKVKLYSLFETASDEFIEGNVFLYGKIEKVRFLCKDLIWKPAGTPGGKTRTIRFVLVDVIGCNKRAVLMCSDLNVPPLSIIRVYGLRFKIETGFDDLKNDLGCFNYHFWSKSLPRKKKWKDVVLPTDQKSKTNINKTRKAIEMHVASCCIAAGILTIIAFRHKSDIWAVFPGFLRTVRSTIPSIATTRNALAQDFHAFLPNLRHLPVYQIAFSKRKSRWLPSTLHSFNF